MTKGKAANENGGGSALASAPTRDELAALGDGVAFEDDGLGEASAEDIKIAAKVINMKGKDASGRKIQEDAYYDTVDETVKETINAAFLHLHKTNLYSYFDNAENRTRIVCRSFDRVTGTINENADGVNLAPGTERPCKGCPDAEWHTTPDGKRNRNCSPVYNLFAVDRDAGLPFVLRFKKTALPVIKQYLQKHHLGRRIVNGQRLNYPLYCFAARLSCRMDDGGKYALPVIQRGEVLPLEEIRALEENARTLREAVLPILSHVEQAAESREGAPDTSFDPDTFAADEGKDFVA